MESQQHWFMRDPIAMEMAAATSPGYSSTRVPVREVITRNAAAEQAFDAPYRLILFPSDLRTAGAWRYYDVTWMLEDAATHRSIWTTRSESKHLVLATVDEASDERARLLIEGVLAQISQVGLLTSAASTP